MRLQLGKLGTFGEVVTAILCLICFPKLALIGIALGLGVLAPYESWFDSASQIFLASPASAISCCIDTTATEGGPALATLGFALVPGSLWFHYVEDLVCLGLFAVVTAAPWGCLRCEGV